MCLILDANRYGDFLNPDNEDMKPVREWLRIKNGKIAYSPTQKFRKELSEAIWKQFVEYREKGKLKLINKEIVQSKQKTLPNLKSDDHHIIALALAANVKLLVSADEDLHEDFKQIVGGKIYQNKTHERLLTRDLCR